MNDQELTALLREAKAQSPKPSPALAKRTLQAYRGQFARPSFLRRHWRFVAVAASVLIAIAVIGTRSSTGSPLPPEYERPDIVASGRLTSRDGWHMEYYTVVRPRRSDLQTASFAGASISEAEGQPIVFHRYLGDGVHKLYFGYDIVLQTYGRTINFRPLSVKPDDMPAEFRSAGSRILEVRELPSRAFQAGQNVAVTLLTHPTTGQTVVDYVNVDTSIFEITQHILGNIIRAFHSHFKLHGPPTTERQLHPAQ
jgi:hypothetical protein